MLSSLLVHTGLSKAMEAELGSKKYTQFAELMSSHNSGMWLYPGVIKRKIGLSTQATYKMLKKMEDIGIIESYFELYCSICQRTSGIVVQTFNELPETFECELCQNVLPSIENAILIYKVLNDGKH